MNEKRQADAEDQAAAVRATQQRNRAKIVAYPSSGESQDVTEPVVSLLDSIHNSMDWGSGFLNREELEAWQVLAELLDFDGSAINEVDKKIHEG